VDEDDPPPELASLPAKEQTAFDQWRSLPKTARVTGWSIWCASLAHRHVDGSAAQQSRPAFDAWLARARAADWDEFDAWCAAARWSEKITL
jgi:hypothetical protein